MPEPPSPDPADDRPATADAGWLLSDEPAPEAAASTPSAPPAPEADASYDLGPEPAHPAIPVPPTAIDPEPAPKLAPAHRKQKPRAGEEASPSKRPALEPSEAVEQVWSRRAEWGSTMMILAAEGLASAVVVYLLVANELFGPAVLCLIAGGLAFVLLSYPILITLERPVRVTPEQAVNDFFGALSHHLPHFRRMWLLLSTAGRTSGSFATFEGFSRYWKDRLAQLRGDRAGAFTPLKFQVVDFKSEKSAGAMEVSAKFRVEVSVRGKSAEGTIASIPVRMDLVRGPDRMWYLGRGTLPLDEA